MTRVRLALLLLAFSVLARADLLVMEVIPLKHRLVNDLLPTLRELVAEGGSVTGLNNQLIIRTTPANLADLKHVLEGLDQRQQQLRITVRQNVQGATQAASDQLAARVRLGHGEAHVGGPGDAAGAAIRSEGHGDNGSAGVSVESYRTDDQDDSASTHFVSALEGTPAFIGTGHSVPVPQSSAIVTPFVASVQESLIYREVGSGVYVTPRLAGADVTLEISPYNQQLSRRGGGMIDERGITSVVRGRLGEWISLGGATGASHDSTLSELHSTARAESQAYDVWVKVEVAP